ncbi:hypothetical protein Bca4012_049255 [Brassica carinata]|nr:unnamed protein product [Brassica napus]
MPWKFAKEIRSQVSIEIHIAISYGSYETGPNNNETGLNQFLSLSLSLKRILDMEMRMTGLETTTDAVKVDLLALKADFKEEITATRSTLNMILQALHSQVSLHAASVTPTTQPQAQPGTTTQQSDLER